MNFKAAREADPTLVLQGVFEFPRVCGETPDGGHSTRSITRVLVKSR
jgi:hypothetical protein